MSLPAWPGYLGDDSGLIAPRRESGKPVGRDSLGKTAHRRTIQEGPKRLFGAGECHAEEAGGGGGVL